MRQDALILGICRFTVAFVWLYQGLVPKLLGPHADELAMNAALGLVGEERVWLSYAGGSLEVLLGIALLVFYRQRWPWLASLAGMLVLYVFTLVLAPAFVIAAFNSTTVNLSVAALSLIALLLVPAGATAAETPSL
jgi:hypothetical protein